MSSLVAVAHSYDPRTSRQTTSNSTSSRGPKTSMVPLIPVPEGRTARFVQDGTLPGDAPHSAKASIPKQ
jgi:hypothetical protein